MIDLIDSYHLDFRPDVVRRTEIEHFLHFGIPPISEPATHFPVKMMGGPTRITNFTWADRFKVESVEGAEPPRSWFYNALLASKLFAWFRGRAHAAMEAIDERSRRAAWDADDVQSAGPTLIVRSLWAVAAAGLLYGVVRATAMLAGVAAADWGRIVLGATATFLRVMGSLAIALAWTVPVGVAIGFNPRLSRWCQPIVQIAASVPATALFPVLLLVILRIAGGMNLAAILLMLMGTQWYLLFNIIAGATAVPQDLKYSSALLGISRLDRWRVLILPSLFPYLVTGAITATGGACRQNGQSEPARPSSSY